MFGLLNPWIIVGGAYLAKIPSKKLNALQDDTKHERAMQRLEWESAENHEKAKLAKAVDEALKEIDDEDIRERLKEETSPYVDAYGQTLDVPAARSSLSPVEVFEYWNIFSPLQRSIVKRMGKRKGILLTIMKNEHNTSMVQIDGQAAPKASLDEYSEAMQNLHRHDIVRNRIPHSNKVSVYELTDFGSTFAKQIPQLDT